MQANNCHFPPLFAIVVSVQFPLFITIYSGILIILLNFPLRRLRNALFLVIYSRIFSILFGLFARKRGDIIIINILGNWLRIILNKDIGIIDRLKRVIFGFKETLFYVFLSNFECIIIVFVLVLFGNNSACHNCSTE